MPSAGIGPEIRRYKSSKLLVRAGSGPFWLKWAGLPLAELGLNILSKGVEIGPTATQFGPARAQTMHRLSRARLRQAELFQMNCGKQT